MMNQIEKTQEAFFSAIKVIQEQVVLEYLNASNNEDRTENLFYNITSETICQIMSLLDGYFEENVQLEIIDKESGVSLREGIELHDKCIDFLKWTLKDDI